MEQERKTYASREALYNLNPAQIFNVVADLETYIRFAENQAMEDNPGKLTPSTRLRGSGRTLVLHTEIVDEPSLLTSFDLAELVLSDDNRKLTLATHKHPKVAIPSDYLQNIAEKYHTK